MSDKKTEAESLDDLFDFDSSKGRYDGPEVVEDPRKVAWRLSRRSNMEAAVKKDGPRKRSSTQRSGMDDIFGS